MNNENKRIDIDAIEKEWTDFLNSKKFKMDGFFFNVQPMIAELKRCYEKIDWLQKTADLATDYIGEIHHSYWDIFEERMIEAGLWERPSE